MIDWNPEKLFFDSRKTHFGENKSASYLNFDAMLTWGQ